MSLTEPDLSGCKVKKTIVERLEVIGPSEIRETILDQLHKNGFNVVRSGPYTDKRMHPRVDVSRFLFMAERKKH